MTPADFGALSDEALIAYFRDAAIRKEKSLYDTRENNRIDSKELLPCYKELAARGQQSARKILQLVQDESPEVRLNAAIYGFDLDPLFCRAALIEFLRTPDFFAGTALIMLLYKDPEVSAEFSRIAESGAKSAFEPLVRRFANEAPNKL